MLTKISTPTLRKNVLIREQLFKRLDKADHESAIWLTGPAGSGKTSLIASYLIEKRIPAIWYQIDSGDNDISNFFYYLNQAAAPHLKSKQPPLPLLTPEYSMSIETFTFQYFEKLYQRLQPPKWMILDNYQEIPNESLLVQLMTGIISKIPLGFKLVVISRHDPPQRMARLVANQVLKTIGGQELVLSLDECRQLIRTLDCDWSEKTVAEVHRLTNGWMAGLILLSLHASFDPESQNRSAGSQSTSVFDYFAAEVFEKCDTQTQRFLAQTAVLPHMTADAAKQLTQMDAEAIIAHLQQHNHFLEQRQLEPPSYQYHPLFRDFLVQMASRLFSTDALKKIIDHGARIMADMGDANEAVALYRKAGNFQSMAEFILSQAPSLLGQGRTNTLNWWIDGYPMRQLPEHPWLLFWKGVCQMHINPKEGKSLFIQAYEVFVAIEDPLGQVFSWSALIQVIMMIRDTMTDLDVWIIEGQRLEAMIPEDGEPDICGRFYASFLLALSLRNLGHPDFFRIQERCEQLLPRCTDQQVLDALGSNLGMSYIWMGQMNRMEVLLKHSKPILMHPDAPPVTKYTFLTVSGIFFVMSGNWAKAKETIEQTLEYADETGIHVYDFNILAYGAYIGILTGDSRHAQHYIDRMEGFLSPRSVWDSGQYHYIRAAAALLTKDFAKSKFHLDEARNIADYSGTTHPIGTSLILEATFAIERNDYPTAMEILDNISHINVSQHTGLIFYLRELLLADCALVQDRKAEMNTHLKAALTEAATNGLTMPLGVSRERLSALLSEAIGADIEPDMAIEMIHRFQLTPSPADLIGDAWPWPIKIYTLGRVELYIGGECLSISGKTPKKPLELLKLLICKHGQRIHRDAVMDQLWSEADGDRAVQNMNTTLHRLRKLLGQDKSVILDHGHLSLNREICWVDAWHFEALVEKAKASPNPEEKLDRLSNANRLYSGPFSGNHDDIELGTWYAQRLKTLWVEAILDLGRCYITCDRADQSKDLLQHALTIDDSVEPFYRELIELLHDQGQLAEAQLVFNRCQSVLSSMGLTLSDATAYFSRKLQAGRSR